MAGCLRGLGIDGDCGWKRAGEAARESDRFTSLFLVHERGDGVVTERCRDLVVDTLLAGLEEAWEELAADENCKDSESRRYQAFLLLAEVDGGSIESDEGLAVYLPVDIECRPVEEEGVVVLRLLLLLKRSSSCSSRGRPRARPQAAMPTVEVAQS